MAENIIKEEHTYSVQDYPSSYFSESPVDRRFVSIEYHSYKPKNSFKYMDDINFELLPWYSNTIYLLHDALLEITLVLSDEDGKELPSSANVAVVNNILHSSFKERQLNMF